LFLLSLTTERSIRPLLQTRFNESAAAISPDGKWIAYQSNRSGAVEVYVAPFPGAQPATQISTQGGSNPRWPAASKLYFRRGDRVMKVDIEPGGSVRVSPPQQVAEVRGGPTGLFDVTADGRILIVEGEDLSAAKTELRIVLDWHDELKRLVPPQ
jgi:serine/threonine-protein kinase